MHNLSSRIQKTLGSMSPFMRFFSESTWSRRRGNAQSCDFVLGNPNDMPLEAFVSALEKHLVPQNKDWFAYKLNEPQAAKVVASSLSQQRGVPFEAEDVFLTNGAFAALSVSLCALIDPGNEVIFISPPWFFYEAIITAYGGQPIRVRIDPNTHDLNLAAIKNAITARTRAIIINSPNNPTGKIYPPETLRALAEILTEASQRHGQPIYLLSDEAYSRIVFDDRPYPSPTAFYPHALLLYTYGKTLLTPGQRLGYIALPPTMPERESLRQALFAAQLVTGFAFPNALLQHALADLDKLSIDIEHLQRKRDQLVPSLQAMGYDLRVPEGTFYLLVRSPIEDDLAFAELLAGQNVFILPGTVFEMPGFFRISLTASDSMLTRSLAGFKAAMHLASGTRDGPPLAPTVRNLS